MRSEAWAGTYGNAPGIGPDAAADADLNLVWGNNATVTNLHLVRNIRMSKRHGGRLVVIDPLRSKIAEQADLRAQGLGVQRPALAEDRILCLAAEVGQFAEFHLT